MTMVKAELATTPGRKFYEDQITLLQGQNADELIDKHYTDDAVMISFSKVVRGRQPLKEFFRGWLKMAGKMEVVSLDQFVETDNGVLYEATIRTALGQVTVYDAFVLRDGKATHHFAGTK